MAKPITLVEETISKNELKDLSKWILSNPKLTKGSLTIRFEEKFSKFLNIKSSIFVNSGSSANLLMANALLEAKKIKNKIVVLPAVSWITTVMPFLQLGYKPIFCDCNLDNLGIDISSLEIILKKHRPSTTVLCNVLGHPNHMDEISRLCKKYNSIIIEDNCESLGSTYKNKNLGTFGLASSHSFYYGHHMSTIEGGMVSTNDDKFKNVMLSIRSHGWARDLDSKYRNELKKKFKINEFKELYTFFYSGFNLRSTDLNAKIGLSQMKFIKQKIQKRNSNLKIYQNLLSEYWQQKSKHAFISAFAFPVLIKNPEETYLELKKNSIESRPLICGNIINHPVLSKFKKKFKLKNSDIIDKYGIYLPCHDRLSKNEINKIANIFKKIAKPYK